MGKFTDDKLIVFFVFFVVFFLVCFVFVFVFQNIGFHISCKFSADETFFIKCQSLFPREKHENNI